MPLRIDDNSFTSTQVTDAVNFVTDKAIHNPWTEYILNVSWVLNNWSDVETAVQGAHASGIFVVGIANPFSPGQPAYPCAWEHVTCAVATDNEDFRSDTGGYPHQMIDVGAPGGEVGAGHANDGILTTTPYEPAFSYYYHKRDAGPSLAAPLVSGLAGLIWSKNPNLSADSVRIIIESTADQIGGYNYNYNPNAEPGQSLELGHGRINALQAVLATPALPPGGGCPYVFTWTGTGFSMDNNLLLESEFEGGYVIDYYKLMQPLVPQAAGCALELREWEQEHSSFDEVVLERIDHLPSVSIAVAPDGRIASYRGVRTPHSAVDQDHTDHLGAVSSRGGRKFEGQPEDELILTFRSPPGSDLRELLHEDLPLDLLLVVDKKIICGDPPCPGSIIVQVPDGEVWRDIEEIHPRALWEDYLVALAGEFTEVQDSLQVRLLWTAEHDLDMAAFLLPSRVPLDVVTLPLLSAEHSELGSVTSRLAAADSVYAELDPGQAITVHFDRGGDPRPSLAQSYVLVSKGYYTGTEESRQGRDDRFPTPPDASRGRLLGSPNPLRGAAGTELAFTLSAAGRTTLVVYDVRGRLVRQLIDQILPARSYRVPWDARDTGGHRSAPGIYVAVLQAEGWKVSEKLLVLP